MADNVHRKSHSKHLSDNATTGTTTTREKKLSNNPTVVHRTTSETIRIGPETEVKLHQLSSNNVSLSTGGGGSTVAQPSSLSGGANNQCRKKTSSFQITSVTVGCRMSNDAGEDSNDDLDESHTEDNSVEHSRITDIDIETPSYSEDTFSKEDVFFNTSNAALGTAPVIPTSSQYGLAIVPSEGNNVNNSVNDNNINTLDISSVTDNNIINLLSSNVKQDTDIREVHSHRNERFKVVKIESTEPFKRGRWTCMDYLDHTSVNQPTAINSIKVSGPNEVCISYGFTDVGNEAGKQTQNPVESDNCNKNNAGVDSNGPISHQDIIQASATAGSYPISQQANVQQNQQQAQIQQQPNSSQLNNQYFQPSQQQQMSQQGGGGQGATLPSNLQPAHPTNLGQPQSMPQGSIPIITQPNNNNVTNQQNITHTKDDNYVTLPSQNQTQQQQQTGLNSQNVCQQTVQPTVSHPPPASSPANQTPSNIIVGNVPHHQQQPLSNQVSEPMAGMQSVQSIHAVPQVSTNPQQQNPQNIHGSVPSVMPQGQMPQSSPGTCQNVISGIQQQQPGAGVPFHHSDTEQDPASGIVAAAIPASQSADATLLESLAEVTQSNDDHHTLEDNESMSGTSAVAIDNKIEQAMDLVKSHLMFAVREEVEVLKEKIAELMDRINQLEAENSILKSHATADILSQLSSQSATTSKLPQNNAANNGQ